MSRSKKTDIKELTNDQLVLWLESKGLEPYRAAQILKWIYLRQTDTFDIMTDVGKEIRKLLSRHFSIARLEKARIETSQDGSKKYLFKLNDGKYVESVLIPEKDHYTLCISTQIGCAQGCRFCLTARGGLVRNLSRGEIIAQVRDVSKCLAGPKRLTNIVLMGMGEPLANYSNVVSAINTITDSNYGLGFSSRRLTLSTAGIVPKLSNLGRDTSVNLAISLNATDNKTRNMLMPINRKYPLEKLLDACAVYPLLPRRRITFEYILIKGINDSVKDAKRLVKLLRPIRAKINLIPFNEYEGSEFNRPEESAILNFKEILNKNNYTAVIRYSKGQDISAACGQLRANLIVDA
ncbi:MAG: 23S rRNA (adenine(2503)-C(2))-methyltransferase RlmN [Thermodesulfobacteriota bacterium]|nr:23S rRNA (adenine(2503)-C(2))-methyltransferase RlmN [Thermodesulfobacteriota bacterium]